VSAERSLGLQWRLAAIYILIGAASSSAAMAAYLAGRYFGLDLTKALGLGFGAGFLCGLIGAIIGSMLARSVKLRLWEAGRMAGHIARGNYQARLEMGADDEVGWLEEQLNQMAVQLENAISSLRELAEQNRRLGEEAGRGAALEERMRLARDLHDTVNQQLFVLAMRTAATKNRLGKAGNEAALLVPEMEELENLARQAHSQIRELILQIRPVALDKEGLGAALNDYVRNTAEREGWVVTAEIDSLIQAGGRAAESLFRISQEALNNISKHASARKVGITLTREGDNIKLSIFDDGSGFDLKKAVRPTAVGLSGIRERAEALGGKVNINSSPGRGTEIKVLVPFVDERGEDE